MNTAIKRRAILIIALLFVQSAATAGEFARTLTPEKMQAAGLTKLTPEELARLETLVQRYKAGEAALPKAQGATTAKTGKLLPAWVGALITLERTESKPEKSDALESQLAGNFSGWSGRTTFRLDNGQLWTQANSDSYVYAPTLKSPKVKIYPASFGTFWLEIEGVNKRCRVRPVKLE